MKAVSLFVLQSAGSSLIGWAVIVGLTLLGLAATDGMGVTNFYEFVGDIVVDGNFVVEVELPEEILRAAEKYNASP